MNARRSLLLWKMAQSLPVRKTVMVWPVRAMPIAREWPGTNTVPARLTSRLRMTVLVSVMGCPAGTARGDACQMAAGVVPLWARWGRWWL